MKIFIDPGHGGHDGGAVGNGLIEKNLTLDISLRQKALFEKLGHDIKISRSTDIFVPLSERVRQTNSWGADIFISNHINAGGGQGAEVWHSINGGKGKEYAIKVDKELSKLINSRGLKSKKGKNGDYLYVIKATSMPAILNEFAFIDNTIDAAKLRSEVFKQQLAEAVILGVCGKLPKAEQKISLELKRLLKLTSPILNGEDIRIAQGELNKKGYPCVVDGWYGPNTKNAVINFQSKNNLTADGVIGAKTWDVLINK